MCNRNSLIIIIIMDLIDKKKVQDGIDSCVFCSIGTGNSKISGCLALPLAHFEGYNCLHSFPIN